MLLETSACGILAPEMSGDVSEHSSWPPQDEPCQTRGLCEPWTPGRGEEEGGGEGGGEGEGKEKGRRGGRRGGGEGERRKEARGNV